MSALRRTGAVGPRSSLRDVARLMGEVVRRRKHIVLLGLNGSGKTTILLRLKYRLYVATAPTVGFNHEKVWAGGYRWSAWDVGGGERLRPLWATYARATDGLVFVVDSSSPTDVMEEARLELAKIVKVSRATCIQLGLPVPPLLVLANFQDKPFARTAEEVARSLGLTESWYVSTAWDVACVCGRTGEGLHQAMDTLRGLIDKVQQETHTQRKDKLLHRWH